MCIYEVLSSYDRRRDAGLRVNAHFLDVQILSLQTLLIAKFHAIRCKIRQHVNKFMSPAPILGVELVVRNPVGFDERAFVLKGSEKNETPCFC